MKVISFHSIGFPCERGESIDTIVASTSCRFHSIGFPCERGGEGCGTDCDGTNVEAGFPFNWFPLREGSRPYSPSLGVRT